MHSLITLIFVCFLYTFVSSATTAQQACSPLAPGSPFYETCKCNDAFPVDQAYSDCLAENPPNAASDLQTYIPLCNDQLDFAGCPLVNIQPTQCTLTQVVSISPANPVPCNCDDITIVFQAVDAAGKKQTYGGASFVVNGVAATDNGDGTYTAVFPPGVTCSKTGNTPIPVTATCLGETSVRVPTITLKQCPSGHCVPDPHWLGFYNSPFDYHGHGDFFLAQSGGTLVQVRTRGNCVANQGVTCPQAIALLFADGTNYELYAGYTAKLNHINVTAPTIGQTIALGAFGSITRPSQYYYNINAPEFFIQVQEVTGTRGGNVISIYNIVLLQGRNTVGLLSSKGRNGETWGAGATLAKAFGDSWIVRNQAESLFTYYDATPDSYDNVVQPNAEQNYNGCNDTNNVAPTIRAACAVLNSSSTLTAQCGAIGIDTSDSYINCVSDGICAGGVTFVEAMITQFVVRCKTATGGNQNITLTLPASASQCVASGPGVNPTVPAATTVQFNVTAYDALGDRVRSGGALFKASATPSLSIVGPRDNRDGTYTFQYVAINPNTYTISVTLNSAHISNSPLTVNIQ